MTDKATHPADTPLYPIREVSRITGVNSVTLRAWERRYGLICPQRTPKGHRLYAREDIDRVERILQWLSRGVPVSQVKELLDQPETAATPEPAAGDWPSQRRRLITAVEALDTAQLESLFNQSLALYPVTTCLTELWQPVIHELEEAWGDQLGALLQRRVLESFLRTRIGTRLYHANQAANGPVILLNPLPDDPGPLWLLLAALASSQAGYRVRLLDTPLPFGELPLAVERFGAAALLLVSGRAERADLVRRLLPRLAEQLDVPLGLCGPMARIRESDLRDSDVALLGDDLPLALARLQPLLR
ncbi:MerR family transcriptional regulator [Billgrantia endophytica]|uniref:Helix-turn-helix-type transcriptional regulator n=1 Tax=Billgrantia endophytica TaxID=2033802 RepID=A0A2N7U1F4_9GAMM|nr:MerR family transcriptional regulator [Halomonas endophytica]PMR74269.1 helix-turn-helix-type transcriptional regulator [Halomonas endophytica]